MKTLNKYKLFFCTLFFLVLLAKPKADAQIFYRQSPDSEIIIDGKSTLRDWSMSSDEGKYSAEVEFSQDGKLEKLNALSFTMRVESLKSNSKALDNNAYSTMETDVHKAINFKLTKALIGPQKIHCTGNLTIAGTTNSIDLEVTYQLTNSRMIICSGVKKLKMSDYKVNPPVFMFGTVRTNDEINVSFNVRLVPIGQ